MVSSRRACLLPVLMALLLAACGGESAAPSASALDSTSLLAQDTTMNAPLAEVLRRQERFRIFSTMLDSARLLSTLQRGGPYTVFAPTDAGLQRLPEGLVEELLLPANRGRLRQIAAYHLHRGQVTRDSLPGQTTLSTLTGQTLPVAAEGNRVLIGNEQMSEYEVTASNGRLFALDALVMPPVGGATEPLPSGGAPYDTLDDDDGAGTGGNGGNGSGDRGSSGSSGGTDGSSSGSGR